MVNTYTDSIRETALTGVSSKISNEIKKEFYIFFSIDLSNSTQYKSISNTWPNLINKFYSLVNRLIGQRNDEYTPMQVWKYVGDEVIFYKKLEGGLEEIEYLIKSAYEIIKLVPKELGKSESESIDIIYAKGTLWGANITKGKESHSIKRENLIIDVNDESLDSDSRLSMKDFIGPDIDLGFRLAKHSRKNELVVSLDLTYLLQKGLESCSILENFRIIKLEALKGIWNGRKYPIIWYRDDESWKPESILLLEYDANLNEEMPLYSSLYDRNTVNIGEINLKFYDAVYKERIQEKYFEDMLKQIKTLQIVNNNHNSKAPIPLIDGIRLHLAGIVSLSDGSILIRNRGLSKTDDEAMYDFDCTLLGRNQTISEKLDSYYSKKLGLAEVENFEWTIADHYTHEDSHSGKANGIVFITEYDAKLSDFTNLDSGLVFHDREWISENKDMFIGDSYKSFLKAFELKFSSVIS